MLTVGTSGIQSRIRITGLNASCGFRDSWSINPQCWSKINQFASVPVNSQTGNAYVLAMKTGAISANRFSHLTGTGAIVTADLHGRGVLIGLITASGDIHTSTTHLSGMKQTTANLSGAGHVYYAMLKGQTTLAALIRIGFQPSADDIAQAIWNAAPSDFNNPNTMGELQNDGAMESTLQAVKARTDNLPIDPADESDLLAAIANLALDVELIKKIEFGRWKIDPTLNTMTFYDTVDDTTPILVLDLLDGGGNPPLWSTLSAPFERMPH